MIYNIMDAYNVESCNIVRISTYLYILALLVGIYLLTLLFLYHCLQCLRSLKRIIWLKLSRLYPLHIVSELLKDAKIHLIIVFY